VQYPVPFYAALNSRVLSEPMSHHFIVVQGGRSSNWLAIVQIGLASFA